MKTPESIVTKIVELRNGEKDAFSKIYQESYGYLHTCVIHIVKNEDTAQDMLQEAYTEIYRNIGQLKQPEDFLGWASTIANRKCFAYLKKDRELLVDETTDEEGNATDFFENIADDEAFIPENILDDREKVRMIRNVIDDLSAVQRACVIGFYYNEQKQDEIASELGIPVNTVKSHLNRAKAKLKESIADVEKKQGVKLCGMSPFMLLLFSREAADFTNGGIIPALGAGVTSSAEAASGAAVKTVAVKTAAVSLKTKIIAGVSAAVIGAGAITGGILYQQSQKKEEMPVAEETAEATAEPEPAATEAPTPLPEEEHGENYIDVSISLDDLMSQVHLYDRTLSEADYDWYLAHCGSMLPSGDGSESPHSIGDGMNMTWWKSGSFSVEGAGFGEEKIGDHIFSEHLKLDEVLGEFDPSMLDLLLQYGKVEFQNGEAAFLVYEGTGLRSYQFLFDEEDAGGKGFNAFIVDAFHDDVIYSYSFLNMTKVGEGIPLSDYDEAYLKEMDEKSMIFRKTEEVISDPGTAEDEEATEEEESEAETSEADTEEASAEEPEETPEEEPQEEPSGGPQTGIITGSFDVDPVIDRYANASKISELNEIVAAGTKIHSSSGKTMIVYYNGESGDFLGYDFVPQTAFSVGKHEVSADSDSAEAMIRNTAKWRMNVYRCTDGDGDLYVDFYAVP